MTIWQTMSLNPGALVLIEKIKLKTQKGKVKIRYEMKLNLAVAVFELFTKEITLFLQFENNPILTAIFYYYFDFLTQYRKVLHIHMKYITKCLRKYTEDKSLI